MEENGGIKGILWGVSFEETAILIELFGLEKSDVRQSDKLLNESTKRPKEQLDSIEAKRTPKYLHPD